MSVPSLCTELLATGGHWWPMVVASGLWWSLVVAGGCWWSLVVTGGLWWLLVVTGVNDAAMVVPGMLVVPGKSLVAAGGCWQSLASLHLWQHNFIFCLHHHMAFSLCVSSVLTRSLVILDLAHVLSHF